MRANVYACFRSSFSIVDACQCYMLSIFLRSGFEKHWFIPLPDVRMHDDQMMGTTGPRVQSPGDHRTTRPEDHKTRRPLDHGTREPNDPSHTRTEPHWNASKAVNYSNHWSWNASNAVQYNIGWSWNASHAVNFCWSGSISHVVNYSVSKGSGSRGTTGPEDQTTMGPEPHQDRATPFSKQKRTPSYTPT